MRKTPLIIQKYRDSGFPDTLNCVIKIETPSKVILAGTYGEELTFVNQYVVPTILNFNVHSQIGYRDTATILLTNSACFPGPTRLSNYLGRGRIKITFYITPRPIIYQLSQCIKIFSGQTTNIQYDIHTIEIKARARV